LDDSAKIRFLWPYVLRFREMKLLALWTGLSFAAVFALGQPRRSAPHVIAGAAAWIPLEYLIHRFVLHARGRMGSLMKLLRLDVHWRHHLDPTVPKLVFTPWWASLALIGGTAAVGSISDGAFSAAGAALGMSLVSCLYETTHLAAHLPYSPKTAYGRFMRKLHLLHHFHSELYWFGVTHPLGDWLAGTWKRVGDVPRSETVRTLGTGGVGASF
jgi:4-hydroxysphinganine ceramide fatty acyl 2-hydroxylase